MASTTTCIWPRGLWYGTFCFGGRLQISGGKVRAHRFLAVDIVLLPTVCTGQAPTTARCYAMFGIKLRLRRGQSMTNRIEVTKDQALEVSAFRTAVGLVQKSWLSDISVWRMSCFLGAMQMFGYNKFKAEMINELMAAGTATGYRVGDFIDLCRGPHIPTYAVALVCSLS